MRDLSRFLENPFDDERISLDELIAFSTDHLQRLIANNPGALFNTRITATTTAQSALELSVTTDNTKLGLRKARKKAKDTFREVLPEKVARIHAAVVARYGPEAPEVVECFPQGRGVFGKCPDDLVATHLQTMITGVQAHESELGVALTGDASGLLSSWLVVYGASESSTSGKSATQLSKQQARANLQLELFKNLLTIALNFPRQPEHLGNFMQQHLLEDHPAQEPEPENPPSPPAPPA